jgi:hypothetical protein
MKQRHFGRVAGQTTRLLLLLLLLQDLSKLSLSELEAELARRKAQA